MDNLFGNFDLKDKKHIMIDIETLSTRPNAVIYEIAAIEFKLNFNDDAINGDPIFANKIIDANLVCFDFRHISRFGGIGDDGYFFIARYSSCANFFCRAIAIEHRHI